MILTTMAIAVTLIAPGSDPKSGTHVTLSNCLIMAIDDFEIPTHDAGLLIAVNVTEDGQTKVKKGTPLAQIDDRDLQVKRRLAEIEASAAKEQAENTVAEAVAEKTAAVARTEWENATEINAKSPRTVSDTEVRRLHLTFERYELEAEKARLDQRIAGLTEQAKRTAIEAVENDIRKRRVEAPIDGVIEKVYKRAGEWVTPGEQVARIVRMDRLRVQGLLPADHYSPEDVVNQPVVIEVSMIRGGKRVVEKVTGKLDNVSAVIEASHYRFWVEVDNPETESGGWLLRPGQYAEVTITLKHAR